MPERQLREQLEALHRELQRAGEVDEESRALLSEVMADIRRALERAREEEPEGEGLIDRLREAVGRFEGAHPQLTQAANRVADALSKLGI